MGNHTRALQEVAKFLSTDSYDLSLITDGLVADGKMPGKFQMAFEVELFGHETGANVKQMLPALQDKPLISSEGGLWFFSYATDLVFWRSLSHIGHRSLHGRLFPTNVRFLSGLPRRNKGGLSQDLLPGQFR
jgi:hypothetical protein